MTPRKQTRCFSPAERYATGIRNAEAFWLRFHRSITCYATRRDQLYLNWLNSTDPEEEATPLAEELMLKSGGDYALARRYYDGVQNKLVLAPEYGGDGGKAVGVCANKMSPVAAFPAHWAPNGMVRYDGKNFPRRYRDGVFIVIVHGIARPTRKVATTSFFSRSPATTRRALARYSPTALRERRKLPKAQPIVRQDWRSGPTGHSTFLKTFTDEFIASSTRAIPPARHPRALRARAFLLLQVRSFNRPPSRRRVTPKIFPCPKGQRQIWLRSVLVFTTVRWEERVAPVATAQMARVHPWVLI